MNKAIVRGVTNRLSARTPPLSTKIHIQFFYSSHN